MDTQDRLGEVRKGESAADKPPKRPRRFIPPGTVCGLLCGLWLGSGQGQAYSGLESLRSALGVEG